MKRQILVIALAAAFALVIAGQAQAATNDPLFAKQWGLAQIKAEQAWATTTGSGITVGIVDSGIDHQHPDLASKVVSGNTFLGCGTSGCGNGDWRSGPADRQDTVSYHGTHVAGIVGAIS